MGVVGVWRVGNAAVFLEDGAQVRTVFEATLFRQRRYVLDAGARARVWGWVCV